MIFQDNLYRIGLPPESLSGFLKWALPRETGPLPTGVGGFLLYCKKNVERRLLVKLDSIFQINA